MEGARTTLDRDLIPLAAIFPPSYNFVTLLFIAASWNEEIQVPLISQIQLYVECTTIHICINLASLCLTLLK